MISYRIPGYARLRKRRRQELLAYLAAEGWEDADEFKSLQQAGVTFTDDLCIKVLALDLNGTLSLEGRLVPGVADLLIRFQTAGIRMLILTGDARGTAARVRQELEQQGVVVEVIVCDDVRGTAFAKLARLMQFGLDELAFLGNGQGDSIAVRAAAFSVALTQVELASSSTVLGAVGHATSIVHALSGLLDEKIMRASFHQ